MAGRAFIGTSGWNYAAWREDFYGGRPPGEWLPFCAVRFNAVEINATHYRLQSVATFRRWRDATPPQFRFALKAHRYLTHNRKLRNPLAPIRLERSRVSALGGKLAVVLWQLPHNFHRNLERLERFARAHRIAVCQSDAADWPLWDAVTTDLVYVRLHGHAQTYASSYPEAALRAWAHKVRRWTREGRDVHVYFDNDAYGYAPRNAARLAALVSRAR